MEQIPRASVRRASRREPLAFAYIGLVLFMIVYFARPEDWIPGLATIPLAKITGVLILGALVFSTSKIHWKMPQEIISLILLILLLWVSAFFSPVWRGGAVNVMLDFSKVLPLVIVIFATVRSIKRLRWILLVQAAAVASIAIASIINRHVLGGRLQGALSGMFGDPNDFAVVIDLSLPLCLALALTADSSWKKLGWIVAMLAMVYAVLLTASRAGAITLFVAALVCIWELGVKRRRLSLLLIIPLAVTVIGLYSGDSLRTRFEQMQMDSTTNAQSSAAFGSAQQRKELFFQSLRITGLHPFLGVGPGNFVTVSGMWHVTHNSYTQVSAEGGIPAFILYLLILWRGMTNIREVRKRTKTGKGIRSFSMALEASLAAYLVGSFFLSLAYNLFPYCLIAYTTGLLLIVQKDQMTSHLAAKVDVAISEVQNTAWE